MAIIVDKIQKRKDIALACKDIFIQKGIKNLTIAEVATTAKIGKGTIYEYFKNKEEIVFEIVNILIEEHNINKKVKISQKETSKEKILEFFSFFHNDEDTQLRGLYKEFISINLSNQHQEMREFQSKCFDNYLSWFREIIEDGIARNELIPQAIHLANGLFAIGDGFFITNSSTNINKNIKEELNTFCDTLFQLMEVKK